MHDEATPARKIVEQQIDFLVPGMEVARDVTSIDGVVLVTAGTVLQKSHITTMQNWNIAKIFIFAEIFMNPITDPKVQQFINSYNQSVTIVQKTFDTIRETQEVPLETFTQTADTIAEQVVTIENMVDQLYNLPDCDDYTFRHSVNVSAVSALIATWLKYPADSVSAVALAGLLHDVGKSQLPPEILNRVNRLTPEQYELYKSHTTIGYDLAKKAKGIAESVLAGIVEHHERVDGSGYPNRLSGDEIHPYARIVAIADLFDEALTIAAEKPGALSPYTSLDKLREQIYSIDAKTCMIFRNNMLNFLSGNSVILTNGQEARVVCINKEQAAKSIVQLDNGKVLDLAAEKDLFIHHVIK
ncbi:MAG: HD domain-containing protein [Sporomusaceae bacterium]|nr:HD domain-containing protein [Sporomusaceae bacterium]